MGNCSPLTRSAIVSILNKLKQRFFTKNSCFDFIGKLLVQPSSHLKLTHHRECFLWLSSLEDYSIIEFLVHGVSNRPWGCLANFGHTHKLGTAAHPCSWGTMGTVLFKHWSVNASICYELFDLLGQSLLNHTLVGLGVSSLLALVCIN